MEGEIKKAMHSTLPCDGFELADSGLFKVYVAQDKAALGAELKRFNDADSKRSGCFWDGEVGWNIRDSVCH